MGLEIIAYLRSTTTIVTAGNLIAKFTGLNAVLGTCLPIATTFFLGCIVTAGTAYTFDFLLKKLFPSVTDKPNYNS